MLGPTLVYTPNAVRLSRAVDTRLPSPPSAVRLRPMPGSIGETRRARARPTPGPVTIGPMSKAAANLRTVGIFVTIAGTATAVRMLSEHKPWEVYTFPDKLLSIRFPKQPAESDEETSTPDGPMDTLNVGYQYAGKEYDATVVRLPPTGPFDGPLVLANAKTSALEHVGATASEEKLIEIDSVDGIEIEYMGPNPRGIMAYGRMRLFVSPTPRAVYLVNVTHVGDIADPNAKPFLDSMHLGTKVESE